MNRARAIYQLIGYLGLPWLLFRLTYAFKLRSGLLKRSLPVFEWHERPLSYWLKPEIPSSPEAYAQWRREHHPRFFFDALPTSDKFTEPNCILTQAEDALAGCWLYFNGTSYDVGFPPDWHRNPATGQTIPTDKHWTQISDFDAGDIKYIWEASRFSVVYTLVRAFAVDPDPKYARAFWQLVFDWAKNNPPQRGPNWKCGQEASFRVMAWCFGFYAFYDHASAEEIAQFVAMIAAHGERIEKNIAYAQSQNNNHGVSEGVGLWTIGVLFPEFKRAQTWAKRGKNIAEAEIKRQTFEDGSYAQYSPNYQRVMLHDALWALRLGELNENRFSRTTYDKVTASTQFLLQLMDPESGHLPNHGSNDGALILPLNDADYLDFRPVIQTAHFLIHRERIFPEWLEDLHWLFGEDQTASPINQKARKPKLLSADVGGYYTLRDEQSWLMVRCTEHHVRPHHADQLHVDFWWRGINICCDAGTYLYNGDPPWQNGLATTRVHNTLIVDEEDQMTPYSHFLWLDWSRGYVHHHDETYWEGSHTGYQRLEHPIKHRRGVQKLGGETWIVVDEVSSTHPHNYRLHWLLPIFPHVQSTTHLQLDTPKGQFYLRCSHSLRTSSSQSDQVDGWRSPTYGQKEPALSLSALANAQNNAIFWTMLSPQPVEITPIDTSHLSVNNIRIKLGGDRLIEIEAS